MKRHYALILALLVLLMTPSAAAPSAIRLAAASGEAAVSRREETVYADMNADGSVREVLAVVRLRVDGPGTYTDYGAFGSVTNLTNGLVPELRADGALWTFPEALSGFCYQAALRAPVLPFELKIGYTLNGAQTDAQALAGASGDVGIHVAFTRPEGAAPYFTQGFMAQLQLTFPAGCCEIVDAGGGVAVLAGSARTVTLACLPGQNLSTEIHLSASGFELTQASLAMTPYDIASILADNMPELDLEALSAGLDELDSGLGALKEGTRQLKDGASGVTGGLTASAEAAKQLKSGASQLSSGMTQINTAMEQYETLFKTYITGGDQFIKLFKSLVDSSKQLSDGMAQLSSGLEELSANAGKLPEGAQGLIDGQDELIGGFAQLRAALDEAAASLTPEVGEAGEPVSFLNGSADIASVQFVGNLPAIRSAAPEKAPPPAEEPSSFWDKLSGLFK